MLVHFLALAVAGGIITAGEGLGLISAARMKRLAGQNAMAELAWTALPALLLTLLVVLSIGQLAH